MTSTTGQTKPATLSDLQRPSGAFAMLAVDQREALRNMLATYATDPVTDEQVREFKLTAARELTPIASAVLIDRQFALQAAIDDQVVSPTCALIASADHFETAHGELVGDVTIDRLIDARALRAQGAVALKLLVIYRPDSGERERKEMVTEFVEMCRDAGLVSIIEPVSRKPLHTEEWDWNAGIIAAAEELGSLGADLYKAEVPFHGNASDDQLRESCRRIANAVDGPWVVLSSGVDQDLFPHAVQIACEEGASGFLAGRAVWAASLGAKDVPHDLATNAKARLERLIDVVDRAVPQANTRR